MVLLTIFRHDRISYLLPLVVPITAINRHHTQLTVKRPNVRLPSKMHHTYLQSLNKFKFHGRTTDDSGDRRDSVPETNETGMNDNDGPNTRTTLLKYKRITSPSRTLPYYNYYRYY